MNRKTLIITILGLLLVLGIAGIGYAVSPETQAKIVAEEELCTWLKFIEPNYKDFHYSSQDQVMKSHLGEPIKNYIIYEGDFDESKTISEQMKYYPFYVFPVMVGGEIITDFTVVLQDEKWKVVDIGGHLSSTIYEQSKKHNISANDNKILRFAGQTIVITKKDNTEVGYTPYYDDSENGLEKNTLVFSEVLKKALASQQKKILEEASKNSDKIEPLELLLTGTGWGFTSIDGKQEGLAKRLHKYLSHVF